VPAGIRITGLGPEDSSMARGVAELLMAAVAHIPGYCRTLDEATAEVRASFGPARVSRVALDGQGEPVGWVGGIEQYGGHSFELHPLVVKPAAQRRGIGRALVADLEEQARRRGAATVYLGTDDEFGGTTLSGVDLYPDVLSHVSTIRNLKSHPYEFYLKCGYAIVGVLPDANGPGRPDIFMARRL
jgi:aminoglycoside 6'-N-acetyltransferase I